MSGWFMVAVVLSLAVFATINKSRGDHAAWLLYAGLMWAAIITHVALGIAGVLP